MAQLFFLVLIICVPIMIGIWRTSPYQGMLKYRAIPKLQLDIEPYGTRWPTARRWRANHDRDQWQQTFEELQSRTSPGRGSTGE
jgi:hypothetical protein